MSDILQPTTLTPSESSAKEPYHGQPGASDQSRIDIAPLANFFGTNDPDIEQEGQMRYIAKFFEDHGINDWTLLLMNIRNIESNLGLGDPTQTRLMRLYNYIKTQRHIEMLSAEKQSMER